MQAARAAWFERFAGVRVADLVFLDEFGATTAMTRTRGRCARGRRLVCKVPAGHWKVISTVAAMTAGGVLTAGSFEGATDAAAFQAFVGQFLVPRLRPGQVVVMDNLAPHKSPRVAELIESAGCRLLLLPPYSPDYNPIEKAISKIKALLRKRQRRTVDDLYAAIGEGVLSVTADEALAFIRHCGYSATAA